jgi:hypothetical protein
MARPGDRHTVPPSLFGRDGLKSKRVPFRFGFLILAVAAAGLAIAGPIFLTSRTPETSPTPSTAVGGISGPSMSAVPVSTAISIASTNPAPCRNVIAHPVKATNTVAGLSSLSDLVVVGTVQRVDAGRWNSPDGLPPVLKDRPPLVSDVYHLVSVKVTGLGKHSGASALRVGAGQTVEVRVVGGTIGCSRYAVEGLAEPGIGQGVGLFLGHWLLLDSATASDFDVLDIWPVNNGLLSADGATPVSISDFLAASQTR